MRIGRRTVNIYFWLILFAYIIILAYGGIRGFDRGFVRELQGLIAGICSAAALILISGLVRGSMGERVSTKAMAIALLIVLAIIYSLCRMILSAMKLFAGLPVIKFVDKILGVAAGITKSFLLLYIVDHLLKIWLNV